MKKTNIKLAIASTVAATAIISPVQVSQVKAANNIDQLMVNVQNASTVLKWAISVEGSADGVTQPWEQYNNAKNALASAEKAISSLSFSEQLKYDAKLTEAKLQLKRTQAYLDAITASNKIKERTSALSTAVLLNDLDQVEKAYHEMTAEFRKQTILLDRVYGQSTRDKIRNTIKGPAEKLINELKNEVTVHMLTKEAKEDIRLSRQANALRNINEAQAILNANILKWESSLQTSLNGVINLLPVQISSISRTSDTTLNLKLNRPVTSVRTSEFTADNGLVITNAVLSKDGMTVTLTTSAQTPSLKYAIKYKGSSVSFSVPGSIATIQMESSETQHRDTSEVLSLKGTFAGSYGYNTIKIDIPTGLKVLSINGIENNISGSKSVNVLPDKNGSVTITFTASSLSSSALDKVITFSKLENSREVETLTSPKLNFYTPAKTGTISSKKVYYVDVANNYFVTTDGAKYIFKGNSNTYKNEGVAVSLNTFKDALDINDTITGNYQPNSSSNFNISTNYYSVPLLLDSDFAYKSSSGYRMIGNEVELTGSGQPNFEVFFFKSSGSYMGKVKMNSTGKWKFKTPVEQNNITNIYMVQQEAGKKTPTFNSGSVFKIIEGPFNLLSITNGKTEDQDLSNEELTFTIAPIKRNNGTVVAQDQAVISKNAYITLKDEDGTTVQYTNNLKGNVFTKTTNGFKIKFGNTIDGTIAAEIREAGSVEGLSGPLQIVSINGIKNTYNFDLSLSSEFIINKY
ncbi:hypothetical protein NSQ95_03500 [Psychrobacillus sp. FSL W7-1457]|uniref:hypothetical protein n=1 Tax=Psychrobacillus sp. FSL W7-1457 TaxID=2954547 RepID=UPI003159F060